ncbi:hypothetical protein [Paraburkholderia sp. GAS32]|jgi:hypothetical protein|uniref:hypothetical protein n=1 Tax=Paraburkholderia sp. GAS32 TaxID=3035129 RepID=UPI003D20F261
MRMIEVGTDLTAMPGVRDVTPDSEGERIIVTFVDGSSATIERDPLALFSRRDSYIMRLSGGRADCAGTVVLGQPRAKVIEKLAELGGRAASAN